MKVGYVRVSTEGQNTARQEELMKELQVERVYIDRTSGKSADRPELQKMMNFVREGDSVIVESISRYNVPYKVDTARGRDCLKC